MKSLSIIIPFWRYNHYLKECFQSLKDSTYQNFDVILVLDHADESVNTIIDDFSDALTIKKLTLPDEKHGVAAARNFGIAACQSDYFYLLDSDDYLLDHTLEVLMDAVEKRDYDIVYGPVSNTWNNKGNFLEKRAKKEIDEEDLEEKEILKQEKLDDYLNRFGDENKDTSLAVYNLLVKRKGISTFTALGVMYNTQFVKNGGFTFKEDFRYYSDMTFMCPLLENLSSAFMAENAEYIKRKHNDPINKPALWQEENDNRFFERCDAVEYTRTLINPEGRVRYYLDRKIVVYVTNKMAKRIRRSKNEEWRTTYFERMSKTISECNPRMLDNLTRNHAHMIQAMIAGDLKGVQKAIRWKLGRKKLKKIVADNDKNTAYKLAYYHIYLKQPVKKNVVLFETFMAKNYSDSPKYIYEYLAKNYSGQFECVWACNDDADIPYGAKKIKRFSFEYSKYLATAQYLVFNVRQPLWYRKREEQTFVETWHGTPLKRLVFDQDEVTSASPKYKQQFFRQRQEWDYLISANPFSTTTFRSCFMYEGPMLEYGYPRNDILYHPNKDKIAKDLRQKLGIPEDKKTILYAPTWRDDEHYGKGEYKFTLALDLQKMKEELSDEYVVLLRTHHYIADNIDTTGLEGFTYNLSKYDDISEIYLISDICITDYSSVFFDYANLKRPVLFYTYDIEKYKNQLRGFYIDMNTEIPGPLLYTSEEVIDAIKHIDEINEKYKERYDEFYDRFCCYDDGNASKNVVEEVFFHRKGE